MNTKDIDELETLLINDDQQGILGFFRRFGIDYCEDSGCEQQLLGKIENNADLLEYFKTKSNDFIRYCVPYFKNKDVIVDFVNNREKYDFRGYELLSLAKLTENADIIRDLIEEREKYYFLASNIVDLAKSTKNVQLLKDLIDEKDKYEFDSNDIASMVSATSNTELISSLLDKKEEYKFDNNDIAIMASATGNTELISSLLDKRKEYEFDNNNIVIMASATGNTELISSLLDKRQEYKFTDKDIVSMASATGNAELISNLLDKRQEYEFDNKDIVSMALSTKNIELISSLLEQKDEYGFDLNCTVSLAELMLGEEETMSLVKNEINQRTIPSHTLKTINLPPNMTIGVEIEAENGINRKYVDSKTWYKKGDSSLVNGLEIVSPVLSGQTHSVDEMYSICEMLQATEFTVSERCGGHIHVGADYLTSIESYKNLMEIWSNSEKLLYIISNKEGEIPRQNISQYAQPISKKMENAIENGEIDLDGELDLKSFVSDLSKIQGKEFTSRYSGINFKNTLSKEKNTIEFRLSNGTLDPNTWVENINLYGGIILSAEELSVIQKKEIHELTEEDVKKLKDLEILKSQKSSQEEKLEALLSLTVIDKEHDTYRKRYSENSKLLNENSETEQQLDCQVSDKVISINSIGKTVLTGKDAILGEEYMQIAAQLQRIQDIEEEQSI